MLCALIMVPHASMINSPLLHVVHCAACEPGFELVNRGGQRSCQPCAEGFVRRKRSALANRPKCTACPTGRTTQGANRVGCSGQYTTRMHDASHWHWHHWTLCLCCACGDNTAFQQYWAVALQTSEVAVTPSLHNMQIGSSRSLMWLAKKHVIVRGA